MDAALNSNRPLPYKVTTRDLIPRSLNYHPGQQILSNLESNESQRLKAVAYALSVSDNQVFSEEQDRAVFLGCLVATAPELALMLGTNLRAGNFRILDVLVRCGLQPSAEVLCNPTFIDPMVTAFGKELLKANQSWTMRGVFCNLVFGLTAHSDQVRSKFLSEIRSKKGFIATINAHLVQALDKRLVLPPASDFEGIAEILGHSNMKPELKAKVSALIASGSLRKYFGKRADLAAQQLASLFLGPDTPGLQSLNHAV